MRGEANNSDDVDGDSLECISSKFNYVIISCIYTYIYGNLYFTFRFESVDLTLIEYCVIGLNARLSWVPFINVLKRDHNSTKKLENVGTATDSDSRTRIRTYNTIDFEFIT